MFFELVTELETIIGSSPSLDKIERFKELVQDQALHEFAFDHLTSLTWLTVLSDQGFFSAPPNPIRNELEGTISFPPWRESKFLARMAPYAPDVVHEIALRIPDKDNLSVHQDLVDIALSLPAKLAADFVPKAQKWLDTPWLSSIPGKLGQLVAHLAKGGQVHAALELARALLAVRPEGEDILRNAKGRFESWNYEEILTKHYPALTDMAAEPALELLVDLLDDAIQIYKGADESEERVDYSQIWIASIEPNEQNRLHDVKESLALALRDALTTIVEAHPPELPRILALLDRRSWWIFERLALYLLRRFPTNAVDLIRKKLTDRALFDEPAVRREYGLLAEKCFPLLAEEDQTTLLGWIENEPEQPNFRQSIEANFGRSVTDEELEQAKKGWRVRRLRPMRDSLPPSWRKRYDDWVKEVGEADYPELALRVHGGAWEPSSPKTAEELRQMSTSEVVNYLKAWESAGDPMHHPSRSGLAQELGVVTDSDVERFARDAPQFIGLDPTYVRTLLGSLRSAAIQKKPFNWKPVLQLLQWIVAQPRQIPGREAHQWEEDPDWGWSRRAITDLLGEGFKADTPLEMPFEHRIQAWDALLLLTDDSDPTPEEEKRHWEPDKHGSIPHHTGVRGDAMNTVVQYALWVRRALEKRIGKEECQARGFKELPEVQQVLDGHLDPEKDPSIAVRTIYGRWFPWLHYLDRNWAAANILKVFPREKELEQFREAAWDSYVSYCPPYNEVFEVLKEEYRYTLAIMESAKPGRRSSIDPDQRLTEHLVLFYGRGKLDLSEEGLLALFFKRAPEPLRAYFVEYAGRTFEAEKDLGVDVRERFKQLWTWRLKTVRIEAATSMQTSELASFDGWFSSGMFEDRWALTQLSEALKLSKGIHPSHRVLERLAAVAEKFPFDAVSCLDVLVEKDVEAISLHAWSDNVRTVIRNAIASGDAPAKEAAVDLIHRLGARGFFEFRNLLPS